MEALPIDIRPADWQIVRTILEKHVPLYEVWAFGSRARWEAKDYSDLDLVVITDRPLSLDIKSALDSDFSESDLPFKVDVVDWATASPSFREIIQRGKVVVQEAKQKTGIGNAWRRSRIRDIARINPEQIDGSWSYSHIRYIDISSVGDGQIETPPCWMKAQDSPSRAKRTVRKGDTVLSTVRPGRRSMFFASCPQDDWILSTGFAVLRPHSEYVDPRYLYYCVFDPAFTEYLVTREKGAAYPAVSPEDIANAVIQLPPIQVQRTISAILGTLDDKIELNRKMNETLEAMAHALFKSWFVDFEPVRAKMEGRSTGLPPEIEELFPNEMMDSEMGEIPKGWEVGWFGDVVEQLREQENPLSLSNVLFHHYSLPAFDEGQTPKLEYGERIKSLKSRVPPGTILLSKLNPEIERVWLVDVSPGERAICSTEFLVLHARTPFGRNYAYCLARSPVFRQQIEGLVTGTSKSHQRAQVDSILDIEIVIPPSPIIAAFERSAAGLLERTFVCRRQSLTLAAQRDTLLSKLITGEVRIDAATDGTSMDRLP